MVCVTALVSALVSKSEISRISGSSFLAFGRRRGNDEAEVFDDSDEDGDVEVFDGLEETVRGEAFLLGFLISVACSVGAIDSTDVCVVPVAASFLVVVPTGAGGSSLKTQSPSSLILKVYQSGASTTLSFLAVLRKYL